MTVIPFNEAEIADPGYYESPWGGSPSPIFKTPVTPKENMRAAYAGEPYWMPTSNDMIFFHPTCQPCYVARGTSDEADPLTPEQYGGKDMFGVEWVFDYEAWGSIEVPDTQPLEDANDWRDVIKFPDVDSWDWEGSAAKNKEYLESPKWICTYLFSGYFERLISFMGFSEAAVALIDEDQQDAVYELFDAMTDLYIDIIDHFHKYYPNKVNEFILMDDWAGLSPFFSVETVETLIAPHMKRLVDHIHELGYIAGHHCCGNITSFFDVHHSCGFDKLEAQEIVDRDLFYEKYGDSEMLTISPDPLPENATPEQARSYCDDFVEKFFNKGKKGLMETYYVPLPTEYYEELYVASRKKSETF